MWIIPAVLLSLLSSSSSHHHHNQNRLVHFQGPFYPQFDIPTERLVLTVSNYTRTVRFNCSAPAQSHVSWHRVDRGKVVNYTISELADINNQSLIVSVLSVKHGGQKIEFICTCRSKGVVMRRKFKLEILQENVEAMPPRFELEDSGFLKPKNQSGALRLTCRARGQPLPQLRWALPQQSCPSFKVASSRVEIEANLIVALTLELQIENDGPFSAVCHAENPSGSRRKRFKFNVNRDRDPLPRSNIDQLKQ